MERNNYFFCPFLAKFLQYHPKRMKYEEDRQMRDEQAGFRQERSCVDQIATPRVIIEQTIEWQSSLYLNFVDFQKAFDSIDHQFLWNIYKDHFNDKTSV